MNLPCASVRALLCHPCQFWGGGVDLTLILVRALLLRFRFSDDHPLFESHWQVARSKLPIPKPAGPRPPRQPPSLGEGAEPTKGWSRKMRKFVEFMIANFIPWPTGAVSASGVCLDDAVPGGRVPGPPLLLPESLHDWFLLLRSEALLSVNAEDSFSSSEHMLAVERLAWMENFTHALSVEELFKKFTMQYRMRNRDMWTGAEKEQEERRRKLAADADGSEKVK